MKKTRKTMIAVLLAMSLVGCSAQEPLREAEVMLPEVTAPQVTEAPDAVLPIVPEEMTPVTAAEETEPVSEATEPKPQETVPAVKVEERKQDKSTPKPQSTEPKETNPVETKPAETKPQPTEPEATEPPVTEEPTTEPPVTEPPATESAPTETVPEEPEPSEAPAEVIDTAALEAYGRSYASDSYGYNGTSECTPNSSAGYFPASTKTITSQEEAERIIQEAIDSQYKRDEAYGYTPYEEVDGETVRCPVNVEVTPTGEPNEYTITVYYGGTA